MAKIARQSKPFLNQKSEGAIESLRSQHVQSIFVFAAGVSMSQKNEPIDHCQNKIEKQYLFLHIIHGYTL